MAQLILILLGAEFLRRRWRVLLAMGLASLAAGLVVFIDALDGNQYFPLHFFAYLLLIEGVVTLIPAWASMGGQKALRCVKGAAGVGAALLIFGGHHHGNLILSMIFGTLFLAEGLLQGASAYLVRYPHWRASMAAAAVEIGVAIFFFQPYPTHYQGTIAYCLGLALGFAGVGMARLACRVGMLERAPAMGAATADAPALSASPLREWDGPPAADDPALTIHVWTPTGSAKTPSAQRYPLVDRYIAAVDANGVISTGHAALESPEGIYISLYPAEEIDRSPDEFGRLLRATRENDIPGVFQPDYATESKAWCPSTAQVRIRNYDEARLRGFWRDYRETPVYNLTSRNCSSSVAAALDAAIEGAVGGPHGHDRGWGPFLRLLTTPELWVAGQIRKRARTMAWTPGLTLDYARAVSMLVDPRPYGWARMARAAIETMYRARQGWRREEREAGRKPAGLDEAGPPGA